MPTPSDPLSELHLGDMPQEHVGPSPVDTTELLAAISYEVNRVYCASRLGDYSQVPWDKAPDWKKDTLFGGVINALNDDMTPEESHENWMRDMAAFGWTYGPVKDETAKHHPCMVPYADLPDEHKFKDCLFLAVIAGAKAATA